MKKFNVPLFYRSPLISAIKSKRKENDKLKKDFSPSFLDFGNVHIYLSRHFGFCYGVENAIEISFRILEENAGKNIFLLSEMIHNPQVNADLQKKGARFLMDTKGNVIIPFETLSAGDIVIVPAFGTTLKIEEQLKARGIAIEKYDTTCPFVEKVWNRAEAIAKNKYSIVVHGKPQHEETRATFSHSAINTPTMVVKDIEETVALSKYINGEKSPESFYLEFAGQFSENFNAEKDLQRIGVVNQTTMLASDTQAIADFLKTVMMEKYNLTEENIAERFADTRDTLCYATMDNQSAVYGMLQTEANLAIVVGGYNSSNTSHLVELCEEKLTTYFIQSADDIVSSKEINHFDLHKKMGYLYIDSGAMYRAITLYFLRNNINRSDEKEIKSVLKNIKLEFVYNGQAGKSEIYLNDENVEYIIRDLVIAEKVSDVAAIKEVRKFAVAAQQKIGRGKGIVMDGRDIGTTVFPDAAIKIFMTADEAIRVERRFAEMFEKNPNISLMEIRANIEMRDYIDSHREVSPLRKAEDAIVLDNTHLSEKQQLEFALNLVRNYMAKEVGA